LSVCVFLERNGAPRVTETGMLTGWTAFYPDLAAENSAW
jgi:hypothetical protein